MVQNQITVSLCLTLLWSSTVGYPSDSLASCISAYHKIEIRVRRLRSSDEFAVNDGSLWSS